MTSISRLTTGSRWPGVAALALTLLAAPLALAQKVKLATSMGDIVVQLDAAKAPKTVDNFLQYVKAGHYNGTVFHRVIDNFMIQGGGMTANLDEKPTRAPIPLESRNGLGNRFLGDRLAGIRPREGVDIPGQRPDAIDAEIAVADTHLLPAGIQAAGDTL